MHHPHIAPTLFRHHFHQGIRPVLTTRTLHAYIFAALKRIHTSSHFFLPQFRSILFNPGLNHIQFVL